MIVGAADQRLLPRTNPTGAQAVDIRQLFDLRGGKSADNILNNRILKPILRSVQLDVLKKKKALFEVSGSKPSVQIAHGMGYGVNDVLPV